MQASNEAHPGQTRTLLQNAFSHHAAGRWEIAEVLCLKVLSGDARNALALSLLGLNCVRRGRPEAGAAMLRRAIEASPTDPLFPAQLGMLLLERNDSVEAEKCFRKALELNPQQVDAVFGLGNLHASREESAEAIACYGRVAQLQPNHGAAWANLGLQQKKTGQSAEAVESYSKAVALLPREPDLLAELGYALLFAGRPEEALEILEKAVAIDPRSFKAQEALHCVYHALGDAERSLRHGDEALSLQPGNATIRVNQGMNALALGDYQRGWREYCSARLELHPQPALQQPLWEGQDLAGKQILLYTDQGLGDTIQFLRYVPLLMDQGARIVLKISERLRRLAEEIPGVAIATGEQLPAHDYQCPLLNLPLRFQTTVESIPTPLAQLRTPEAARRKAAAMEWPGHGLRVGLCWSGNPQYGLNESRSLPLAELEPLLTMPEMHFYSLQMGEALSQLAPYRGKIVDLAPATGDMADTAAQMEFLDLILTVDTSIAHLAGTLGKPVWILLASLPEWRWLRERADSPWYPTARLFRQPRKGDWEAVVQVVCTELARVREL